MNVASLYSIDTSALISAQARYYPVDHFPALWTHIDGLIADGRLICSEEVWEELKRKDDNVAEWMKDRTDRMVYPTDALVASVVKSILDPYELLVKDMKNRNRADPFVIAVAQITGGTVVTEELGMGSASRPKIPGVCASLGIDCITISEIVKSEGWTF